MLNLFGRWRGFRPSRVWVVAVAAGLFAAAGAAAFFQSLENPALVFPRVGKIGDTVRPSALVRRSLERSTVAVPGGRVQLGSREEGGLRVVAVAPFRIGRCEVTVEEYAGFLDATGVGSEVPGGGRGKPVARVSAADAASYCRWLSERSGARVRLPTEDEWECAARGGLVGARYPWGWGTPQGKAQFRARGAARVGRFEPNGFGLYDAAGNVFEWCLAADGVAVARGGSWAETEEEALRVFRRVKLPEAYRGADVGFRVVVEHDGRDG